MITNYKNFKILFHILFSWMKAIRGVLFQSHSSYISRITSEEAFQRTLSPEEWRLVKKIVKGVRRLSPLFMNKRKCLMEALVVFHTLEKSNISSSLKLGIKKEMNQPEAHAWIIVNDIIVIGGPVSGYEELIRTH